MPEPVQQVLPVARRDGVRRRRCCDALAVAVPLLLMSSWHVWESITMPRVVWGDPYVAVMYAIGGLLCTLSTPRSPPPP